MAGRAESRRCCNHEPAGAIRNRCCCRVSVEGADMKIKPESEWLIDGLGAAVLVLGTCAVVFIVSSIVAIWKLP